MGYQIKGCFADTTIRFNDIQLKFTIAETRLVRQSLISNKQQAMTEISENIKIDYKMTYTSQQGFDKNTIN